MSKPINDAGYTTDTLPIAGSKIPAQPASGAMHNFDAGALNDMKNGSAPRPGIVSSGASYVGTTQDNTGLAFGTANISIGKWFKPTAWPVAATTGIVSKQIGTAGFEFVAHSSGVLRLGVGNGTTVTSFDSTVVAPLVADVWAFIGVSIDRAGNIIFYVNGVALGNPVSIASLSAQTATNTAALLWGGDRTGAKLAGTYGEGWIVAGILTPTQFANIYKAGSIAPFCVFTPNATTGQNVATVNGLSFYQWLDFAQGYGPVIKDRSGNNEVALMGTTGLTHAVVKNPPGIPQRAPRVALVGDGSNGSFVRNTLGTQNPGTGDFTLWEDIVVPASWSNDPAIVSLTSSAADSVAANALVVFVANTASLGLTVQLFGATSSDYLRYNLGLTQTTALLGGKRVVIVVTRAGAIYLGIEGDFINATNLFTLVSAGSAPVWASVSVNATLLEAFYRLPTGSAPASLFDLRLANVAMTEAQLRDEYTNGEPGAQWKWGSNVAGTNVAFNPPTGGGTASGFTAVAMPSSTRVVSQITAATPPLPIEFAVSFNCAITNGGFLLRLIRASDSGRISEENYSVVNGANTVNFSPRVTGSLAFETNVLFEFFAQGTTDAVVSAFAFHRIGYTARLRTDTAAGLTALDDANKQDFLLSTTGITHSPQGGTRRQVIRPGTLTFTSPGTLNLQLFGASCIDTTKKWRIVSVSGTANGAANLSLGSASAGAQYISAQAVTAADFDLGTFASRVIAGANLWLKSDATVTITGLVVILEEVD